MRHLWAGVFVLLSATAGWADSGLRGLMDAAEAAPFRAVGRLDLEGQGFCTATLLTERLVLTAAHCVLDEAGRPVPAGALTFRAGLQDGRARAERRGRRVVVAEAYEPASAELANLAADVALVELDRPVSGGLVAPIPAGPSAGRRVGVVSYAHDRAERPAIQEACEVLDRREGTLILSCLADFGTSGAPVLTRGPEGFRVVSVVSAMAEAGARRVSIGSDLTALARLRARIEAPRSGVARAAAGASMPALERTRPAGPGGLPRD